MATLLDEAVARVERDAGRSVRIDLKLRSAQLQPAIGQRQRGPEQRRPDAPALPVIAHPHAQFADMATARIG